MVLSDDECARAIALTVCVLLGLALPGWNSRATRFKPANRFRQLSTVLRLIYRSKAQSCASNSTAICTAGSSRYSDPSPKPLTPFSASETVTGVGSHLERLCLNLGHREHSV